MKSFEKVIQPKLGESIRGAISDDRQIKELISRIVPVSTAVHIVFCRLEDERLRLTVDNAVWLPRLRFMERQIIDTLRNERLSITSVSCHVMPEEREPSIAMRKANPVSARAASLVESTANGIDSNAEGNHPDDSRLGKALLKMARLMKNSAGPD